MQNLFVKIGDGFEVSAKDAVDFFDKLGADAKAVATPRALIALSILGAAMGKAAISATAAAATEGLNIPLDLETTQLIVELLPDFRAYLKTLAIQPAKEIQ